MIKARALLYCLFFFAQCASSWRCYHRCGSTHLLTYTKSATTRKKESAMQKRRPTIMMYGGGGGGTGSGSPPSPFGPLAVVIMPSVALLSNNAEKLEVLDDIFTTVLDGFAPPVVILDSKEARALTLKKLLFENNGDLYKAKDHLVPDANKVDGSINTAVLLFSGFTRDDIRSSIVAIMSWQGPSSGSFPPLAFALAVPPAVDKPLDDLFSEILRDFAEEKQAK